MKQSFKLSLFVMYSTMILTGYALFLWEPWYLLGSLVLYLITANIFTVTLHRYYAHRAFEANSTLMLSLAWYITLFFYQSPASFSVNHTAHHALSDLENDTHIRTLKGFFYQNHWPAPEKFKRVAAKLFRDPRQRWLHENCTNVVIVVWIFMAIISLKAFLYILVIPTFMMQFVGRLHTYLGHSRTEPADRPILEFILPFGGEWLHKYHHDFQTAPKFANKWFHVDTGFWLVKLIRKTK